jgi:hypothetical protein
MIDGDHPIPPEVLIEIEKNEEDYSDVSDECPGGPDCPICNEEE